MTTAVEWEAKHQDVLAQIKDAADNNDPYLAEELMEKIAPHPEGDNVHVDEKPSEQIHKGTVRVIDPKGGWLDNPDGVAVVKRDGTRQWYKKGMLHNSRGPAVLKPNGRVKYYYLGEECKSAAALDETVKKAKDWYENTRHVGNKDGKPGGD